jgi:hypothetical protein
MVVIDTNSNCSRKVDYLKRRGVTAVGRYYRIRKPEYRITAAEAQKLSAAGIMIFMVYEDTGQKVSLDLTSAQGRADGRTAVAQAREIGQPFGSAIYFAVEGLPHGYTAADLPAIRDYFGGVKEAVADRFKLGVYSDGVVCKTLLDEKYCAYTWLSASTSFEGTQAFYRSGRWNLAQKTPLDQDWEGLSVDVNEAKPDFGAFLVAPPSAAIRRNNTKVGA